MPLFATSDTSHRSSHPNGVRCAPAVGEAAPKGGTEGYVRVAAFTSAETRRIGRDLGLAVAVIAVVDDPVAHAKFLSRRWHAAWTAREHWYQPFDDGLADPLSVTFTVLPIDARWMGHWTLPRGVVIEHGTLSAELPRAGRRDFADIFASAMADRRFDQVARRPAEVRRRYATGRPLAVPPRYAGHPRFGVMGPGFVLVDDLYCFRPHDLPGIAAAVAKAAAVVSLRMALAAPGAPGREPHHV